MATKVTMPQMGFDMTEGKVARWLKKVGDPVKQGEAVVEIETNCRGTAVHCEFSFDLWVCVRRQYSAS